MANDLKSVMGLFMAEINESGRSGSVTLDTGKKYTFNGTWEKFPEGKRELIKTGRGTVNPAPKLPGVTFTNPREVQMPSKTFVSPQKVGVPQVDFDRLASRVGNIVQIIDLVVQELQREQALKLLAVEECADIAFELLTVPQPIFEAMKTKRAVREKENRKKTGPRVRIHGFSRRAA